MSSFRIRPKFTVYSEEPPEEIIRKTREVLSAPEANCKGLAMQDHITLRIHAHDRHFWSPQLGVILYDEDGKTRLVGLYGPMPNVWVLFTFGYLALSTLTIFISIIGLSQRSLGLESSVLWLVPLLLGGILFLYLLSQMGQKLGAAQMFTLHHEMENILGQKIPIH
jgi:hypothetical protein